MFSIQRNRKLLKAAAAVLSALCIMAVILALTVLVILPVFTNVYENMAGSLASTSFISVGASTVIGWVALAITVVFAVLSLWLVSRTGTETGRASVMRVFERIPLTSGAMYQLALSRFTAALSTYISSGLNTETAMHLSASFVTNDKLAKKVDAAYQSMIAGARRR